MVLIGIHDVAKRLPGVQKLDGAKALPHLRLSAAPCSVRVPIEWPNYAAIQSIRVFLPLLLLAHSAAI
eukprot:90388-Amphidinium_carterae.1